MVWLCILSILSAGTAVILWIKIILIRRAQDEIRTQFTQKLEHDTNTLICVSSRDKAVLRLAESINSQLRLLRSERQRFQQGDMELKNAITNISHDIRTPLTAICGYLDLLENEEKSQDAARYLTLIENRTQALKELTQELFCYSLGMAAPDDFQLEPVCLNAVLEESIADLYAVLTEHNIVPSIQICEVSVWGMLNKAALLRIFNNIITNALKYSDGDLEISMPGTGEIIFANTAKELDKVQAEKLFNRFYTVSDAKNSTGLGLSISKSLAERMNGDITAAYDSNKLSICIRFPIMKSMTEQQ